ncbi:hypothetical protein KAFR_0G01010 [Kazachstania africana CBS 2517]|uniref:Uncharacterized protein n=1 Tax=Kazachstania africana (strain ATCC 22294 / BCRC 22015 / CBS 2517 / CECT 1963 / NBRC 1671 / NRRL Y-8276) TaxID=1071382 RepID=H2AXN4_KAZAF|nr:hypothetical protein KAFR_0G01010 [Kazachstania africana CBS 2517]CCF59134.1 hypothetical protein KAFR_0G01010 [Kazachstania africana CBS 2517]
MHSVSYAMSAILAVGGLVGFQRKKSVPSLLSGIVMGALYGVSGYLISNHVDGGLYLALGTSTVLFITGVARSVPSGFKKPIPLILTLLGTTAGFYYGAKINEVLD